MARICPHCRAEIEISESARCPVCAKRLDVAARKVCVACQKDVTQEHRTRDTHGNYYCDACWARLPGTRARDKHGSAAPVAPDPYIGGDTRAGDSLDFPFGAEEESAGPKVLCLVCQGAFGPEQVYADGGQYICRACYDARVAQASAMAQAAAGAMQLPKVNGRAAAINKARASVIAATVAMAAVGVVAVFLFSGGPDKAVRQQLRSLRDSADALLDEGRPADAVAKYEQLMKFANQNPRERDSMGGEIAEAQLRLDRARAMAAADAKAVEAKVLERIQRQQEAQEAATRRVAAQAPATAPSASAPTVRGDIFTGAVDVRTVDNKPPAVKLLMPDDGAIHSAPAEFEIAADATDPDGRVVRVEFYLGEQITGALTSAPWRWTAKDVPEGRYRVRARAYDDAGEWAMSEGIEVLVIKRSGAR